jgi:tyrosyl-tRNA synthetase
MNILDELQWRGLIADCTDRAELSKRLGSSPVTVYAGFDPTADSLHAGNLVPALGLRRFQLAGQHPIALAGGATGSIGDPSGKSLERVLLSPQQIEENVASVKQQYIAEDAYKRDGTAAVAVENGSATVPVVAIRWSSVPSNEMQGSAPTQLNTSCG